MKYFTFFFAVGLVCAYAQCNPDTTICTPGNTDTTAICSVPSGTLATGKVGMAYDDTLYFVMSRFIQTQLGTIEVVYLKFLGTINLPPGLQVATKSFNVADPDSFFYPVSATLGPSGCARVFGTPTQAGTYNVGIITEIAAKIGSILLPPTQDTSYMTIVIQGGAKQVLRNAVLIAVEIYPNPVHSKTFEVSLFSNKSYSATFVLLDVYGREVRRWQPLWIPQGQKTLHFSLDVPSPGIYWLQILSEGFKETIPIVFIH